MASLQSQKFTCRGNLENRSAGSLHRFIVFHNMDICNKILNTTFKHRSGLIGRQGAINLGTWIHYRQQQSELTLPDPIVDINRC